MNDLESAATEAMITFICPRCATEITEAHYGPCTICRTALHARFTGERQEVEAAAYEPKMNVTPNAVATKE